MKCGGGVRSIPVCLGSRKNVNPDWEYPREAYSNAGEHLGSRFDEKARSRADFIPLDASVELLVKAKEHGEAEVELGAGLLVKP